MQILPHVLKSATILNLLLLAAAIAAIACALVPLADIAVNVSPPPATEATTGQAAQAPASGPVPAYPDYALVAERNVFHPQRKMPPEKAAGQAIPRPDIILYGTLISDDVKVAYVEDKKAPRTTPGRGKRQIALKKGETLSGYVLKEVERDRIELVRGSDRIVVYLSEQMKARGGEAPRSGMSPAGPQMAAPPVNVPTLPGGSVPSPTGTRTAPKP